MRAVREFNVVPAIPSALAGLTELAVNLCWTWDRETQALFEMLHPALWQSTGQDPLRLLAAIDPARWAELAMRELRFPNEGSKAPPLHGCRFGSQRMMETSPR